MLGDGSRWTRQRVRGKLTSRALGTLRSVERRFDASMRHGSRAYASGGLLLRLSASKPAQFKLQSAKRLDVQFVVHPFAFFVRRDEPRVA